MHKYLLLFFILHTFNSHSQSFVMAKQFHGNDSQVNSAIAFDNSGNIYTACIFYNEVDADPGLGTTLLDAVGSLDIAIIKLNSDGNFVWAIQLGGATFETASVLKTDAEGNVFVFGYFNGTLDMDPSPSVFNLTTAGSDDLFCAKYDADGNLIWAVRIGGTGTEQNYGFDLDTSDNPVIHGYFQNTVDFDPGAGTFNLTAPVGGADFLLKLDNDGNFLWAKQMGAFWGNMTRLDDGNNIFITGTFFGTIDFDPGPATHSLSAYGFGADAFALKLDADGNYVWVAQFSGNLNEQGVAIAFDAANDAVLIGGHFEGTMDADPGVGISNLTSAGYIDASVIKLAQTDGSLLWAKSFGGLGYQSVVDLEIDENGSIHMTGPFEQTVDFDPSVDIFSLTSNGYTDIFRLIWTNEAEFVLAEQIGNNGSDWPSAMELDNTGAEFITGHFEYSVDFNPGPDTYILNAAFTGWDGFIAKYCTSYTIHNYVSICAGESFFAGGALQTEPGDYYDYFIPVEGCDSTVITHLSINTPIVALGADLVLCDGGSAVLNAGNPGATYEWSTGATTQTITVFESGIYSVTIVDGAGCTDADTIAVNITSAPVVDLGSDITICAGESVILNAENPGADYLWNTGAITQTITVTESGNYGVLVTNIGGCTSDDMIHITVQELPIINLGVDAVICEGESLLLDAGNAGATYNWNTGATTQTILVDEAGTYMVEVTNAFSCTAADTILVNIAPVPVVELGDDITICADEFVTLDAENVGAEFLWSTGATTQIITVNATGNYYVQVTNDNGCVSNDMIHITVHDLPIINLGADTGICAGETLLLDAGNSGSDFLWNTGATTQVISIDGEGNYFVQVTNISGCAFSDSIHVEGYPEVAIELGDEIFICEGESVTLDALNPDAAYLWNTGATTQTIEVATTGNYSVVVTNVSGCNNSDTVSIVVNPMPFVDLGTTLIFCPEEIALLDAENSGSNYLWTTGETTQEIIAAISGTYGVLITNTYGCTFYDEVNIFLAPEPEVWLGSDTTLCEGTPLILNAGITSGTYLWNTGSTDSAIMVVNAGTYWVSVTNDFGCSATDTIDIIYTPLPAASFELDIEVLCLDDIPFAITGGTPSGGIYFGEGVMDGVFYPEIAGIGTHIITYSYTDTNGCVGNSNDNITVTICQDIGSENLENTISIYPNPAQHYFTVTNKGSEIIHLLEIADITGKVIFSNAVTVSPELQININIEQLVAGNYIVKIYTEKEMQIKKLIVAK